MIYIITIKLEKFLLYKINKIKLFLLFFKKNISINKVKEKCGLFKNSVHK